MYETRGAAIGGNWLEADANWYPQEGNDLTFAVGLDIICGEWCSFKVKSEFGEVGYVNGGERIDEDCSL